MKYMMRALLSKDREGSLRYRWRMALASYEYSRLHGLTVLESIRGALGLFCG